MLKRGITKVRKIYLCIFHFNLTVTLLMYYVHLVFSMLIQYCTIGVEYLFSLTRYYSISSANIKAS
jgi:hypothetical protein